MATLCKRPASFTPEMSQRSAITIFLFCILNFTFLITSAQVNQQQISQVGNDIKQDKLTRILFILDASGSMDDSWSGAKETINSGPSKMAIAKKTLVDMLDTLKRKPNVEMALRVYGMMSPIEKNDCRDTKLCVPFGQDNVVYIKDFIKNLRPNGITPIAISLQQTVNDFPQDANVRNVIILITDGEESCNGDPCAVAASLQKNNIVLKPFIIGLNVDDRLNDKFSCIGNYVNPKQPDEFRNNLSVIIQTILSPATIQVDLMDANNKPTETDVDMSFYDSQTGYMKYNIYHTITYRGDPDTVNIDPVTSYNIQVHTLPPIEKKNVHVEKEKNTVVEIPAAQGFLEIKLNGVTINNNLNNRLKCLIKLAGTDTTLNVQMLNTSEKYITGKYELEFLTLPRLKVPNVKIDQSKTTTIEIPRPGILNLNKAAGGFGGIFVNENNEWKKIYELSGNMGAETIALQPGNYKIIYRAKTAKKTSETIERNISISSGANTNAAL